MLRVLVVALLATASPAYAATPVSDQYQSAPPPVVKATVPSAGARAGTAAAPAPAATPGASTPAAAPAGSAPAQPGGQGAAAAPAKPLLVDADPVDAALAAPESDLPIGMLAVVGLLALGLAFAALTRVRRPATGA